MSAHREPDVVAEYAKNAQMRGLRVIIAGAGISAALPGAVAAHTELPVIGVPLSGRLERGGRPRRDPLDRADAAGRAGGVRGPRQRPQRRDPRRADPRRRERRRAAALPGAMTSRRDDASASRTPEPGCAEGCGPAGDNRER